MSCQHVPVHVYRDVQEDPRCSLFAYFSLEGRKTHRGRETIRLLKQVWSEQSTTQKETLGQTQIPDTKWYLTPCTEAADLETRETAQTTNRIVRLYTQSGVRRLWYIQHSWHNLLSMRCKAEETCTRSGEGCKSITSGRFCTAETNNPARNQTSEVTRTYLRILSYLGERTAYTVSDQCNDRQNQQP